MHEASLMRAVMRRIHELAAAEGATRVTAVGVWLGALSHMSPDHFREHFERASADSIARGARLDLEASDDVGHADAQELVITSVEIDGP